MMTISYKTIKRILLIFTAVPVMIFFIGWLTPAAAIPAAILLGAAVFFSFKGTREEDGKYKCLHISRKQLVILSVIALIWCVMGGQGGIFMQTFDHHSRNIIMTDLTLKDWPCVYSEGRYMLVYYILTWMLPALLGKGVYLLCGNTTAAMAVCNISLIIQSTALVTVTFLLVAMLTQTKGKAHPVKAAFLFMFFSGLDIVGTLIFNPYLMLIQFHIEWWDYQYASMATGLYYIYNQTLFLWPLVLCLINERSCRDFALLGLLCFAHSPIAFVGVLAMCLMKAVCIYTDRAKEGQLKGAVRSTFTFQNIAAVVSIAPVFLMYYTANAMVSGSAGDTEGQRTALRIADELYDPVIAGDAKGIADFFILYVFAIVLEFGIYCIFILRGKTDDRRMIIGNAVFLMAVPFFQLGVTDDLSRAALPGLLFICVLVIRYILERLPEKGTVKSLDTFVRKHTALFLMLMCFALGSATPITIVFRQTFYTIRGPLPPGKYDKNSDRYYYSKIDDYSFEGGRESNFLSEYQGSAYYKYLSRK
ncbi:MAG: hypothetical protein IKP75_00725 [Oscillospiraceae bacterium]|nr:hypothetical protein [Oscillospiraceae bacterium]